MIFWIFFSFIILMMILISRYIKNDSILFFYLILVVVVISGFRYNIGYDYDAYVDIYDDINSGNEGSSLEIGWILLTRFSILLGTPQIVFLVSSLFIYVVLMVYIRRESVNWQFSIILFIFTINFFWESLSIIRQYIAISFYVLGVRFILNRKFFSYIMTIVIGSLFHKTILFMLPIYFIINMKINKYFMLFLLLISSSIAFLFERIIELLDIVLKYQAYFSGSLKNATTGVVTSGISYVVRIALLTFIIFFKDWLGYCDNTKNRIYINMYLFGSLLFIIFYNSTAIRRIGYYLLFFEVLVFPMVLYMRTKKNAFVFIAKYSFILITLIYSCSAFYHDVVAGSGLFYDDSLRNRQYKINIPYIYNDENITGFGGG